MHSRDVYEHFVSFENKLSMLWNKIIIMISGIFEADYYDNFIPKLTPNVHVSPYALKIHQSEHKRLKEMMQYTLSKN